MTILPEPATAEEVLERARAVVARRRAGAVTAAPAAETVPRAMPGRARAILAAVAAETGVPAAEIAGGSRGPAAVAARDEAIVRLAAATGWSSARVGKAVGRDGSTVRAILRRARAAGGAP